MSLFLAALMDVEVKADSSTVSEMKINDLWGQLRQIENYLGISEKPEDDLSDLQEARMAGSCEWLAEKPNFQAWIDSFSATAPRAYWISANPATGKSVLSGYVINYLESLNLNCSYYFFHHGDKVKASLSGFLRSMALQMAISNVTSRKKLLSMVEHEIHFGKDDEKAIWRKVFTAGILRDEYHQPQYWIIDGLDECVNVGTFFQMITKIESSVPIKIFITSRKLPEIADHFTELQKQSGGRGVVCEEISADETQNDITLYLQANMGRLRIMNEKSLHELSHKILVKSRGCFLWVRLVLEELAGAWSQQQIEQVLEEVPQDMDPFYNRALNMMSSKPNRTKKLTKCILIWTTCATRPLMVDELRMALKLDLGDAVNNLESAITSLCGQLVYVDKSKRILMIHLTARAFLLTEGLQSEFAIDKRLSHLRLAEICLQYLNSDEMKSPRARRSSRGLHLPKRSPFLSYASISFAEHMRQTSSDNQILTDLVDVFLKTNVLSWIEYIAQTGNLYYLTWTAKVLKNYLQRQAQYRSPIGKEVQRLEYWATDFARLAAKFGKNLKESPSSIYWLVPPFCPPSSAIATQYGSSPRGLVVHGLSETSWDDRLACIDFNDEQATALSCGDSYFVVGLSSGTIILFHNATCQELKRLYHREPLKYLRFDGSSNLLVSSGRKSLKVWDVENKIVLWYFTTSFDILALSFRDDDRLLMVATKGNTIQSWNLQTGLADKECPWQESFGEQQFRRPPITATLNSESSMLAIVYRGRPISLWDMVDESLYGLLGRESDLSSLALGTNTSVSSLVFSSNESIPLLAAAYEDGDLALFEYWDLKLVKVVEANAQIVACSPDGCTLATGNSAGMVQLFEFETLQLIYRVNAFDYGIRSLAFSSDNLRLLDVRGKQCNIWEPSILIGLNQQEDNPTEAIPPEPRIIGVADEVQNALITTLAAHDSGKYLFCGKSDGSVWLYETQGAMRNSILYNHITGLSITSLIWGKKTEVLVTSDTGGRYVVRKLVQDSTSRGWNAADILLDSHSELAILQVLLNPTNNLLLVSTSKYDIIWDIPNNTRLCIKNYEKREPFKWANHPLNANERVLMGTTNASIWSWDTSCHPNPLGEIELGGNLKGVQNENVKNVILSPFSQHMVVEFSKLYDDRSSTQLSVFESRNFHHDTKEISPVHAFMSVGKRVLHLIGLCGAKIVFLDRDLWVCSVDTEKGKAESYVRHFFIPSDWYSQQKQLIIQVSSKGDVLFAKNNEIAIIKNGLDYEEEVSVPLSS